MANTSTNHSQMSETNHVPPIVTQDLHRYTSAPAKPESTPISDIEPYRPRLPSHYSAIDGSSNRSSPHSCFYDHSSPPRSPQRTFTPMSPSDLEAGQEPKTPAKAYISPLSPTSTRSSGLSDEQRPPSYEKGVTAWPTRDTLKQIASNQHESNCRRNWALTKKQRCWALPIAFLIIVALALALGLGLTQG